MSEASTVMVVFGQAESAPRPRDVFTSVDDALAKASQSHVNVERWYAAVLVFCIAAAIAPTSVPVIAGVSVVGAVCALVNGLRCAIETRRLWKECRSAVEHARAEVRR